MRLALYLAILAVLAPGALQADFAVIRDLIRRGEFAAALPACDRELKTNPRDYQVWTLKGIALQALGKSDESLAAFNRALAVSPIFLPALEGKAQIEYQKHDPHCRATLQRVLAIRPETPTAHAMLAVLAFEAGDWAGAAQHYEKAGDAALDPVARWQLATCYFRLERWDRAEAVFRELLRVRENDDIRYNLALAQWWQKHADAAIATLEPIARKATPDSAALRLLASAYEASRQTPEALSTLRRALELYPREEGLYIDLGALCLDHGSVHLGIEVLEVGANNLPQSARVYAMLGILQARGGSTEKAEAAFHTAEHLGPEGSLGTVGLAMALIQMSATDTAIGILREKLLQAPDDVPVMTTLAGAILQTAASPAETAEAQRLLEKSIQLDHSSANAHALLGKLYMQQGDVAKAVPVLETALKLDQADSTATYQLMLAYRRQGRSEEAAKLAATVRQLLDAERNRESDAGRFQLVKAPEERAK